MDRVGYLLALRVDDGVFPSVALLRPVKALFAGIALQELHELGLLLARARHAHFLLVGLQVQTVLVLLRNLRLVVGLSALAPQSQDAVHDEQDQNQHHREHHDPDDVAPAHEVALADVDVDVLSDLHVLDRLIEAAIGQSNIIQD